jgi:hypothetical protein
VAYAGNGDVVVVWTASVPNGTPVTTYKVATTTGHFTCIAKTNLTCTVTGLTNGTPYIFVVEARNGRGPSTTSTLTKPVTPSTYANAPTHVIAVPHNGAASVTWTAPTTDGGSTIVGYTVFSHPSNKTCATSTLTCNVTGLANGTTYTFRVRAINATGAGPVSLASNAVVPSKAPTAPTNVAATASPGKATVKWAAATPNGTPIIRYTAISTPGGKTCTPAKVTAVSCTVSTLTDGTAYVFRVDATNSYGTGPLSTPSNAVIPYSSPLAAPVLTASSVTNQFITVSWNDVPPATDGGEAITRYVVNALIGTTVESNATVPATATFAKVIGERHELHDHRDGQKPQGSGPHGHPSHAPHPLDVPGAAHQRPGSAG